MKFFQTNPDGALAKAQEHLAAAEAMAATLRGEREQALLQFEGTDEGTDEVGKIDAAIATQEGAARIHTDRIAALKAERRRQESDRRERERTAAIAVIKKRLLRRSELARELTARIKLVGEAYISLLAETESVAAAWPFASPPNMGRIDKRTIDLLVGDLLFSAGKPAEGITLPMAKSGGTGVTSEYLGPENLMTIVAGNSERLLELLRTMPIAPEDEDDEPTAEQEIAA